MNGTWNNNDMYFNQPRLNFIYVKGIEQALLMSNQPNNEYVYFEQDDTIFYRVKVELDGKKYWQAFKYDIVPAQNNTPATQNDLSIFDERLKRIEDLLKGVNGHEQSNGQISAAYPADASTTVYANGAAGQTKSSTI